MIFLELNSEKFQPLRLHPEIREEPGLVVLSTAFPTSLKFKIYLSNRPQVSVVYLQVNALSEWIIGIYLHEFINNEREISAASCGIENFEFIVSERVQVNPDNSRAMSGLTFLLFKLNTLQRKIVKLWVSRSHGGTQPQARVKVLGTRLVYRVVTNW